MFQSIDKNVKRHFMDYLLIVIIAAGVCMLSVLVHYHYAVFSQNIMSSSITESEYYEEQYEKFQQELNLFLSAIQVPEEVVNKNQDLRSWYYFEMKKKILVEDKEGFLENSVKEKIEEPVRTYLSDNQIELSEEAELGFQSMLQSLSENLRQEMNHPDLQRWYEQKAAFGGTNKIILLAVSIVISVITLFLIQHYLYRGLYYTALGLLLGGLAGIVVVFLQYRSMIHMDTVAKTVDIFAKKVLENGILVPISFTVLGAFLLVVERLLQRYRRK